MDETPPTPPTASSVATREPILTTKLTLPARRPGLVARPRLTSRLSPLDKGFPSLRPTSHLTLIVAPAGFGKSTLVAEWCACGSPHTGIAFLSLDPGDNDPTRFLTYVIAALQTVVPGVGEGALAMLSSSQPPHREAMLTVLLNDIAARGNGGDGPLSLVLDDYHLITEPAVHATVTFLLDHQPPNLHLVLVSRADPPLPLSRLRGRGLLTELRAADLRCVGEETSAFLNDVMGLELGESAIAALEERTEGWIAGLQLAALSLQGRAGGGDREEFLQAFTGSHRYIVDYLGEEVLRQQTPEVQEFLLHTSVLERLSGPLCDAVARLAPGTGAHILEHLDRSNLFLIPLDEERRWWRYHHLFADMLRALRLRRERPGDAAELHLRAANWFAEQGFYAESVEHALEGGLFDLVAHCIAEFAGEVVWRRGEVGTLLRWLDRLPEDVWRGNPQLCLLRMRPLLTAVRLDEIEVLLADVERVLTARARVKGLPVPPEGEDQLWGEVLATRAFVTRFREDADGALKLCDEALKRLPRNTPNLWRAVIRVIQGNIQMSRGDLIGAKETNRDAAREGERVGDLLTVAIARFNYGTICEQLGCLNEAEETYHNLLDYCRRRQNDGETRRTAATSVLTPVAGYPNVGLACVAYQRGEDEAALRLAAEARQQALLLDALQPLFWATEIEVELALRRGDEHTARERLRQWEVIIQRSPVTQLQTVTGTLWAKLALAVGDRDAAEEWERGRAADMEEALTLDATPGTSEAEVYLHREWDLLFLVELHLAHGRHFEALRVLDAVVERAKVAGRNAAVLKCRVMTAAALVACDKPDAAMIALAEALALGEADGWVRPFVDRGAILLPLLHRAAASPECHIAPAYIHRLQEAITSASGGDVVSATETALGPEEQGRPAATAIYAPPQPRPAIRSTPDAPLDADPLTEREIEVLRLVAVGMSNPAIAEELFLSVGTVKRHVHNIYGKLGTVNRVEAIIRARALGLLLD